MESYYDSEEEIAWGPRTLREIKADFNRPLLRLPKRRHTVSSFLMDSSHSDSDMTDMLESHSGDATAMCQDVLYYTPNESLKTEQNSGFLEKLSKAIDDPQTELSAYTSALEITKTSVTTEATSKNESFKSALSSELSNSHYLSLVDINNTEDFFKVVEQHKNTHDIVNFQQTLVENTLLSDDERVIPDEVEYSDNENSLHEELEYENRYKLEKKIISPEAESIIVITDEESVSSNNSICDEVGETFIIKKETSFNNQVYEEKYEKEKVERGEGSYRRRSSSSVLSEDPHENDSDSGKSCPVTPPSSEDKASLAVSPITIPEIDLTQFDDSISKTDSPLFNDTLEEMNRLLNQGLDYTMSDEELIIEATPMKTASKPDSSFKPFNIISSSFSQYQPTETFSKSTEVVNRIPVRICQQPASDTRQPNRPNLMETPVNTHFKIPVTPVRTKLANPTPPKSNSKNLKNIVSPVALYIKNSPCVRLKQNVPPRELTKIVSSKNSKSSSKENYADFPEVEYKPARKQITSKEKEITLPYSFKKLNIKEPHLIKHEGRINQNSNKSNINRKLLESDITNNFIDASTLNNSSDISVLTNKQAYIK